jgi:hypothetical protein
VAPAALSRRHEHEGSKEKAPGKRGGTGTHPRGRSMVRRWPWIGGWRSTVGEGHGDRWRAPALPAVQGGVEE